MRESCHLLGSQRRLAGILTEPRARKPRQALVLISAGLLPKQGPYRLYAQLARRLAESDVATLRFDLGGVGDSAAEPSERPLSERTELEIREAIDFMTQRYGSAELVLGGLCSGAEDAFRAAGRDPRVGGVVMIDPFAYRTSGWGWRHLVHRLGRRTLRALGVYEPPTARAGARSQRPRVVSYRYMERAESRAILEALIARSARVHFIYTAGMRERFNHAQQLQKQFDDLDFRGQVTLDYLPYVDHTQLLETDRLAVIEAIARRLEMSSRAAAA